MAVGSAGDSAGGGAGQDGPLPARPGGFVGRDAELAELRALLAAARLVTIVGPDGAGKTRLARRAAVEARPRFADGAWYADLGRVGDPALIGYALAQVLGADDRSPRPMAAVLADHLRDREALLVLDAAEPVRAACADLITGLLAAAPRLVVVCTGHRPLDADGEVVWAVPPLAEATTLFAVRAAVASPGFALEGNLGEVAAVCREVDRLPLAIELAAAQLRTRTLSQVASGLRERFTLRRAAPSPARTAEAVLDWTYQLCTPAERTLWTRFAVFADDADHAAVEAVCGEPGTDVGAVLDRLVDRAVLEPVAPDRYRMPHTVRGFGGARLAARPDELSALHRRHLDHYLRVVETAERDWSTGRQDEVYAGLRRDHAELRAALRYAIESGVADLAVRLAARLWFYWLGCGFLAEAGYWLPRVLATGAGSAGDRVRARWAYGLTTVGQGDPGLARRLLAGCLDEAACDGDDTGCGYAELGLGIVALVGDDHRRARELLQRALHRFEEHREVGSAVLLGYGQLALAVAGDGDLDRAEDICVHTLISCQRHGERWARGWVYYVLALTALARGQARSAALRAVEGLRLHRAFRNLTGLAALCELMAAATAADGEPGRAAVLYGAADRIWGRLGWRWYGSPAVAGQRDRYVARIRQAIGDAAYERGYRTGAGLDVDQAVGYALGSAPQPVRPADTRSPSSGR